jgi:16S rRNA (cytosine967-C5)-methyltransferase
MPVSPARAAAFDILLRVQRESSYASELLHSTAYKKLSPSDHALATELTIGVLRWRSLLDHYIALASSQPRSKLDLEILISLRLGLYQLLWLQRIPARAALNESVDLVKRARKTSAAAFVNAVLRKLSTTFPHSSVAENKIAAGFVPADDLPLALRFAHPDWLVARWIAEFGESAAAAICRYDQTHPGTSLRLCQPANTQATVESLRTAALSPQPGRILSSALYVESGNLSSLNPTTRTSFAIQDEGSQLVSALAGPANSILDCCAAPGGKTLALLDRNPTANATAVEIHPHRARLVRKLLSIAATKAHVIAADARHLPFNKAFDLVLADVPCSGTGTLARNPEIKWRIQPADIADLQGRQIQIVAAAMQRVAPGGRLIYSTCSLEKEENEDVIERALAANSTFGLLDCAAALEKLRAHGELTWTGAPLTRGPYLRTLPGIHPCDGFFAALLEKS